MFTKKPEPGESVTKMGERSAGEMKTPFTERPTTYAAKSTSPSASKMVPSIIGEDLSITGNVTSKLKFDPTRSPLTLGNIGTANVLLLICYTALI